jgi:hypothetical protein
MFRGAHRDLASQPYDRAKDGVVANARDAKRQDAMETKR